MTTKQYRDRWILCGVASFILNALPIMIYVVKAFIEGQAVYQKVGISITILVTAILTAVSLVSKLALRCRLWYLVIGIYIAVDKFIAALIILAVCQTLDELIVTPLAKLMHQKYSINKEIDKREPQRESV